MGKLIQKKVKVRDSMITYRNKVKKMTAWYNKIVKNRQMTNALGKHKKELRPLSYFIDKIKKHSS
jgi:hypothetical protein